MLIGIGIGILTTIMSTLILKSKCAFQLCDNLRPVMRLLCWSHSNVYERRLAINKMAEVA